jgi:hypothetical protein
MKDNTGVVVYIGQPWAENYVSPKYIDKLVGHCRQDGLLIIRRPDGSEYTKPNTGYSVSGLPYETYKSNKEYTEPESTGEHTKDKLRIISKHGKVYGIRNKRGFVCFMIETPFWQGQHERYKRELADIESFARIFAAAPDLLEVLNDLLSDKTTVNCLAATGKLERIEQAIAKAGG